MACTFMTIAQFCDEYKSERKIVEKNGLYAKYSDAYEAAEKAGLNKSEITIVSIIN